MSKRQLLFVTYLDDNIQEGFAYALDLAKALQEDMVLLLIPKKESFSDRFEQMMASASFAEEGEHESAREIMMSGLGGVFDPKKLTEMVIEASKAGVHLSSEKGEEEDVVAGIRSSLKRHAGIDKVVLSPSITESEMLTTRDLTRLVRTASRPIVTMTRQSITATHTRESAHKRMIA